MKKSNLIRTIILAGSLLLQLNTFCFHSRGAAGDVDLSFDPGSGVNGAVNAVAVQPDGKAIIGGQFTTVKGLARPGIARLNADGSGDSSFNPGAMPDGFISLGLLSDGKVLVGNYSGILRLNSNGSLDPNFSASVTPFDVYDGVYAIAVQPDGKVVIGGNFSVVNGTSRNGIARLNANGSLDSSFNPGATAYGVLSIAVQPDGRLLIGGSFATVNGTNRLGIARLNSNGSLDSSFNPGSGANGVASIALQPDGRVLIGGYFCTVNGTNRNGIARLNANGSLDASFDPGTELKFFDGFSYPWVESIVVQSDGKLVVGGYFTNAHGNSIARFNASGTQDSSFNPSTGTYEVVHSIALPPDGKVLVGGDLLIYEGVNLRHPMARLNANGSLDVSFNPGAQVNGRVTALVVQPDGKVLIGGQFTTVNGANRKGFARLNANGTLDTSFNPVAGAYRVSLIALQADGKVLVGASRLNANGSLDNSFQPNLAALNQSNDCPPGYICDYYPESTANMVQPDGKVLLGGNFVTIVWGRQEGEDTYILSRPFLARFNANGSLDNSFNLSTNFSARAIALQPDGRMLVAGDSTVNGTYRGIARLNANGSLDNTFNPSTGINGSEIHSMALQPDGKVLIGGSPSMLSGMSQHAIARLNANGGLDNTFNPTTGVGDMVESLALQPDGKVLIAGMLYSISANYNTVARLNANGSLDTNFHNPITDTFANGYVMTVALQSDGDVLIGGDFITVDGEARSRVARLYGDSVAPSLNIARSNAFVIVSWPASAAGFVLQQSTNLNSAIWTTPVETVTDNGPTKSMSVGPMPGNHFYRLFKP